MKDLNLKAQLYQASAYNGKSISLDYYRGHPHYCFHYHPEFELVLTRGSAGKRVIGNTIQEYFRKDLVLIGPDIPHTWVSERLLAPSEKCDNIIVHFTRESLGLDFLAKPELTKINHLFKESSRGICFSATTIEQVEEQMETIAATKDLHQLLTFISTLEQLSESDSPQHIVSSNYCNSMLYFDNFNFSKTLEYILKFHDQTIRLEEIASHLGMSVPTFTRFFKRITGKSFIAYLNEWRIRKACVLLRETDWSIIDISAKAGFSNLSNFNRQFLNLMGTSPRNHRNYQKVL